MYLPKSQVEENLTSNGNLVYKGTFDLYYGKYFRTSKGKYFANSPNDIVLIELEIPPLQKTADTQGISTSEDGASEYFDRRFFGKNNRLYSFLTNAPTVPPVVTPPKYSPYIPNNINKQQGYSIRYFAKKNNEAQYIEISSNTYKLFQNQDSTVAITMYEAKNLIWYLTSPSDKSVDEVNLNILLDFEKKYNWSNFHHYVPITSTPEEFLYTEGNELLLPNRTSYVGYYHYMPDGGIMTGKFHGDGNEIILIPLSTFIPTNTLEVDQSIAPTAIAPLSSGGGGYSSGGSSGGGGY